MALTTDFSPISFDVAKQQIIASLKNNDAFLDYDFEGARLNALIDALAYTVTYGGAYANAAVNESWLQLAIKRESVVQHAQGTGYVPAANKASKANTVVTISPTPAPGAFDVLPRGFKFSGQKDKTTYPFVVVDEYLVHGQKEIELVQGRLLQDTYTWQAGQRIFMKDSNIDRRYTKITVNNNVWVKADNAVRVITNPNMFYLRETLEGWTEVYFGVTLPDIDGQPDLSVFVGGNTPQIGDTVIVEYLVTSGADANDTNNFKVSGSLSGGKTVTIPQTGYSSTGGSSREDIERIRRVADKMFQAQGRCVVPSDYESFVLAEFSNLIDAIKCWTQRGVNGYAYIAIKPKNGLQLSGPQVEEISNYLKKYNVSVVEPKLVSPVYVFINHTIDVDYDPNTLDITEDQLKQNIVASMAAYYDQNITTFGAGFQNSKLVTAIDNTHASILGSGCEIDVVKEYLVSAFWNISKGSKVSAQIPIRGISTLPITYDEIDNAGITVMTHELTVLSTDSNKLIIGPFLPHKEGITWVAAVGRPTDVEYTLTDFNVPEYVINPDDPMPTPLIKWYEIGTIDYPEGKFTQVNWNNVTTSLRWTQDSIKEDFIKYMIVVSETSIYPEQGEIIVFDEYLRPDYINLTPHAVTN